LVAVRLPALQAPVDFHIPGHRRPLSESQQGAVKVRAGLAIAKPRVKHPQNLAVQGFQARPAKTLMLPDDLKKSFEGRAGRLLETEGRTVFQQPKGV
jgi:hypothetical protein